MRWLVVVVAASCSACPKAPADTVAAPSPPPVKRSITIGITQEPDTLFLPFKEMVASEMVLRASAYTLTLFDENWQLIPWAAKEIPTLQNGKLELYQEGGQQKMRTTWVIKDEFHWADGTPLTADDFVFTHQLYMDKDLEIVDRTTAEKIEKMESRGDDHKTLVVTWKEPYAYYANFRIHEAVPRHIVEPLYKANPKELKKQPFGQRPMLAGGFTIKEWVPGSHIIAVRNPAATGFLVPQLDEIIWKIIPQTNTLAANLMSHTIDAISTMGLSFDQALQFEKEHGKDFDVHFTEGLVWEHVDFNLDDEILKDLRVRKALAHGANRKLISDKLFEARQPVADGTEPPRSKYFNPDVAKYPYDVAKAKALLDDAGWRCPPAGACAVRERDGKPMHVVIQTTAGDKVREQVEQLLQSQWKELGVDVEIKNQPAKVFFGEVMRHRQFSGMAMYAWSKDPVILNDTLWRCDQIPSEKNRWQGQNFAGWCNKDADDLIRRASGELDDDKRHALGRQFEALWAQELPALPLYFRVEVSVTAHGLKNWKPTGTLQPVSWNAQQWGWQ